ncbi:UNVERIFIED_CONTAM: hypothetical protein HDU68_006160 [Siphonaria sp. JEL0065]|nr:hypothetical protein HDU68_006160 [Siphonaria sp. JEL0065]
MSTVLRTTTTTTRTGPSGTTEVVKTTVENTELPFSTFHAPIRPAAHGNAWDFHIYFDALTQLEFAKDLHAKAKQAFPNTYFSKFATVPIGPHTSPMFKVEVNSTAEFGSFLSFIALHRGELSILAHPMTGNPLDDHIVHGVWIGDKIPLKREVLEREH